MHRCKGDLPDDLREEIESYNRPILLTEAQKADSALLLEIF